ncbi:TPA: S8 family serine peptidase [Streptococcus agalactiae]
MDKHHSKKAILKLTLITTSILLMHSNQVNAEEQELKNQEQSPVIANVAQQPSPSVTTNTVEKTSVTAASASNTAKEMGDTSVKNDKTEDELLEELSKNLDTSNLGADLEEEYPSKPETTNNKESNVVTNASTAIAQKVPSAYEEVKPESKSSLAVLDTSKITKLQAITQRGKGNVVAIIDTGFDINHDIFRLDSPKDDKHSFKTKTEFEELKAKHNITYGKWVNDKIVFAHNYANNTETVADIAAAMKDGYGSEAKNISHGTHVAGIFVGNSKRPAINGLLLEGAAPNAQVLLMRIPDKIDSDKFGEAYAKAITDAVNLGAKTINMSIGKTADSLIALNDKVKLALKLASEKGVAVVVAAGNEGAFGMDYSKPLSTNPDYGTVNSPAISEDTLSVASYESLKTISEVVETTIEGKLVKLPIVTSKPFDKGKAYDVVYANYGAKKDFEGKDFKGKIALIERGGGLDFMTKITHATNAGVVGIVIFNDQEKRGNFLIPYRELPVGIISKVDGERIKNTSSQLTFNQSFEVVDSQGGNRMLEQSSWGVTAEGAIKPDVTASGFEIYSSTYNNQYQTMSGTSMASPHVAGLMTMLQSHLAEKYKGMNLDSKKLLELSKNILMSSATALYSEEDKAFYSPRQQGAGVVDAEKAIQAQYYITGNDGKAKINLKRMGDKFDITVTIHKLVEGVKEFYYQANVATEQVNKGKFALKPQALLDTNWQKVILRDKETQVRFTIDASQFSQKLKEQMANGYFLEGFVRFKEAKDSNQELMSIPFVGFNGDFANLQALETPIYKTLSKGSFYYKPNDTTHKDQLEYNESAPFESNNYTALLTQSASWGYVDYVKNGGELELAPESPKRIILGTFENKVEDKTIHLLERDAANNPYFAISPNKDGNRDEITPQATFLRNVKDISAQVLDQNGNVIWQSKVLPSYRKNFHNNPKQSDGHYRMDALQWSGLDKDGKVVADGFYTYRLRYTPVAEGANSQESDFKVQVSTKSPNLPSRAQFDETNRTLSLAMPKESSYVPTYRLQLVLSHVVKDEEYGDETSYHYFHIDQEGKVTLPKTVKIGESEVAVDPKALTLVVEDKAGNFATVKLSDLLNKAVVSEKENAIVISNSFKYFDNLKKEPMFISKKEKVVNKNLEEIILVKPQTTVTTQSLSKEITKSGNEKVLTSTNNNSSRVAKIISPKHNGDSVNHTLPSTSDRATNGLFVGTLALLSSLLLYLKPKKTKNNSK